MTAAITARRWNSIDTDLKTGSPADGTAGIFRHITDLGTVVVPAEVVDRRRLFALRTSRPNAPKRTTPV